MDQLAAADDDEVVGGGQLPGPLRAPGPERRGGPAVVEGGRVQPAVGGEGVDDRPRQAPPELVDHHPGKQVVAVVVDVERAPQGDPGGSHPTGLIPHQPIMSKRPGPSAASR